MSSEQKKKSIVFHMLDQSTHKIVMSQKSVDEIVEKMNTVHGSFTFSLQNSVKIIYTHAVCYIDIEDMTISECAAESEDAPAAEDEKPSNEVV